MHLVRKQRESEVNIREGGSIAICNIADGDLKQLAMKTTKLQKKWKQTESANIADLTQRIALALRRCVIALQRFWLKIQRRNNATVAEAFTVSLVYHPASPPQILPFQYSYSGFGINGINALGLT